MIEESSRWAAREADRRIFRGALAVSLVTHLVFFLLAGVAFRSSATALQVPEGFTVDLVEVPEVISHVKTPREGIRSPRGDIPVPTRERAPKVKPRAAPEPKRPDQPARAREDSVRTPPPPIVTTNADGAGGRLETEVEFNFAYYTEQITRRVLENWAPSMTAADSTQTTVTFTIQRDGAVTRVATLTPSGYLDFDRDAIRAVEAVRNFAPLPAGFRHDQLKVRFHFVHRREF